MNRFACWIALASFGAAPSLLASGQLTATARVGSHFEVRYPDAWKYQAFSHSGVLNTIPEGLATVRLHFATTLYNANDGGEALRKVAGVIPQFLADKMTLRTRPAGRGFAHTWQLKIVKGESAAVLRVYAIPLTGGGGALVSGIFTETSLKIVERELDMIAGSVRPLETADRQDDEPAKGPPPMVASPLKYGTPTWTAREIDSAVVGWTQRLAGNAWKSDDLVLALRSDGSCGVSSPKSAAAQAGRWRVIVFEGRPQIAISASTGQTTLFRCERLTKTQ